MLTHNNVKLKNITYNGQKVKKWNHNGVRIYNAGNTVTYYVDTDVVYTEEVDSEASCLSPKTFTPAKSDWEFVGWRENNTASSEILTDKIMGDSPITLYAVFKQDITCTFISNGTQTVKGTKYYNNNNVADASITAPEGQVYSGWTWRGWASAGVTDADATVAYANGATISGLTVDTTFYGLHYRTLTLTYYNGNATASSTTGNQYHNAYGTSKEPSFTMTQTGINGWTARGWATSNAANASISYNNGATITLTGNLTIYGCYQISCNLYTVSNGSTKTNSGTRYYNSAGNYISPTFTVASPTRNGWTFKGWSKAASNTTVSYTAINKLTITTNTYLYAVWNCANVAGSASLDYDQTRFFEGTETLATIISSVDTSKYSGVTFNFGIAENLQAKTDYKGTQIDVYISDGTNKTLIVYGYDDWSGNQVSNQGRVINPTLTFSSNSGNKPVYLTSTCHAYGQTTATGSTGYVFAHCTSYTLIGRTVVY